MNFYQFQTVTSFDFGKSSIKLDEYIQKLEKIGYSGGGVADSNNLMSFPYLYNACKNSKVKPIYGTIVNIGINNKTFTGELVVLNEEGYLNLIKLSNLKKEVYSLEDLALLNKGLAFILKTEDEHYKEESYLNGISLDLVKLSDSFVYFYFGIEIYTKEEAQKVKVLRDFISQHSYLSLAFPKVCYLDTKDGFLAYALLDAIQEKKIYNDIKDINSSGPFFLLSPKAVTTIYTVEEIETQEALYQQIDFVFMKKRGKLMRFEGIDSQEELKNEAYIGLKQKLGGNVPPIYQTRLNYELDVINKMNFNDYFLLVSDYVNHFRKSGVKVGPGRGSGAGSLVSYSLNIVEVDPIKYKLYFERFLNPLRKTMPDIDVDFQDDKRDQVINYLKTKYGSLKVSLIVTFSTLQLKAAIRRIGQIFPSIPDTRISSLSASISGKNDTFEEERNNNYKFKKLVSDNYYMDIVNIAKLIVSYPVTTSTHASGVIVSFDPLDQSVPLSIGETNIALYEYKTLEEMGYLKFDILALSNLTFMSEIEHLIIDSKKTLDNPYTKLNDSKTFEVLNRLDVTDIFQLESDGIINVIKEVKPTSLSDISVILALYRPGPMKNIKVYAQRKNNNTPYHLCCPQLEELLKDTYGILIYQEQILEIAKQIAGFDGGKADLFRRAISKKDSKLMNELKEDFIKGCLNNKLTSSQAQSIFNMIEEFANYGFNKSHSYSYAFITYALLYYKTHYPEAFYLCSLNKCTLGEKKFLKICMELYHFSCEVVNPNVNHSEFDTSYENNRFYLGLSKIKGINREVAKKIVDERKLHGKYQSLSDFLFRVDLSSFSNKELTNLVYSGALDEFEYARESLIKQLPNLQMAFKFTSTPTIDMLPYIEKASMTKNIEDFINEYNALGVVLSMKLSDLISGERKYQKLFVVKEPPVYYEDRTKLVIVSRYGQEIVYVSGHIQVSKNDVISINKVSQSYYDNDPIVVNKEKIKYE